jgi:hypothetical protein
MQTYNKYDNADYSPNRKKISEYFGENESFESQLSPEEEALLKKHLKTEEPNKQNNKEIEELSSVVGKMYTTMSPDKENPIKNAVQEYLNSKKAETGEINVPEHVRKVIAERENIEKNNL